MGEVYRATDTNLKRQVAIKVLPTSVAADKDRLARFRREAEVLAALNHPNIAHIHGLERADGAFALVMELVEGPTLADRIARGPIALDEALPIAKQIAEALEAAHEQGIIHRDLKPANIKVRDDGTVKVLDFGLAKAMDPAGTSNGNAMNSPTISMHATQAGIILGTAAYMSPEQARGRTVDRRADIWAFGAVLFEMLTGTRAFGIEDDTVSDLVAAVLTRDPEWAALPANTPPEIASLIRRCLQKETRKRLPHIGLVRLEIDEGSGAEPIRTTARSRSPMRFAWPFALGFVLAAALGLGAWWRTRPDSPAASVSRFSMSLPEGLDFTNSGRQVITISPDGTEFVYVANRRLYRRMMSDLLAQPIPGIDGSETVRQPMYSPDGRSIIYFGGDVLKRIAITGGAPVPLGTFPGAMGMSWGPDGIVFGNNETQARGVLRLSPNGGAPDRLVAASPEEVIYGPQMLPGGKALLFSVARNTSAGDYAIWDKASIVVQRLGSGERQTLITDGSDARYVASGHIVYARGGVLFAVPFDVGRLHVSGAPTAVVQGVARATAGTTAAAQFAVSSNGSLVYLPGPAATNTYTRLLAIFDRKGEMTPVRTPAANINHPRISPDGKRVVYAIDDDTSSDVWTYELAGGTAVRRITFGGRNRFPIWTADGERVVFQSDREGDRGIYWQRADGASAAERLTKAEGDDAHVPDAWSPHGDGFLLDVAHGLSHTLQFNSLKDKTSASFGGVDSRAPTVAVFSPDGRWVAYEAGEYTGADRSIYVQPFPATGARYEVPKLGTGVGQRHPRWSSDGRELFFTAGGDVQLMVTGVSTQPSLAFANPVALWKRNAWMDSFADAAREWDVLPDNQHFIGKMWAVNATGGYRASQTRDIHVVINWVEELKARVPTK